MREYCLLRPLAAAGFFATVLVLTAALGNANRNTDIRPQPESRAGELEECLRELDNDLLGLEGINLHATVDSISQDVSWWPSNSYERQLRNEGQNFECPTLSDVLASAPQLSEIDAALFNACNFFLGSTTNSRFTTVEQSHVPFILVIDPRNVQSSLTTLHSLSGVRGVASTRLYIFVSACGPADASWNLGDTENCKRQSFLQEDSDSLLDFVACETAVSMYLPSDRMMSMHPHRDRGYTTFMVQHQGLPGQEYRKIRDMHALRHVLLIEKNTHTVLLHAGARPLPSFYMYHKASATVAHRSAILVASSGKHKISKEGAQQGAPTSQQASDSPDTPPDTSRKDDELVLTMAHPCLETRFSLSDSLPEGASLGVGRAGLIELFSSLSDSAGLGIVDSLHALHTKWAPNRFFLLPAEIVDIEHPYVQGRENAEHLPNKENHNLANSEVMRNNVWAQSAGDVVKNVGVGLNASTDGEDCVDEVCRDLYDEMARSPEDPLASACAEQGWSARLRPRKVYDCVTYFQEDKMLLLRAKELGAHVDFFIVVEGDRTFQGHVRSLHLPANLRLLEEYAHRIRLIVAELQVKCRCLVGPHALMQCSIYVQNSFCP